MSHNKFSPEFYTASNGQNWLNWSAQFHASQLQHAFKHCATDEQRSAIANATHEHGITAPEGCDLRGKMLRLCDEKWWRRQLKKFWLRESEHRAALNKHVGASTTAHYVAHGTANLLAIGDHANLKALKERKLKHIEKDEEITLFDVAQYAREGRIAELYTFAKGLADYAKARDLTWCMTTLKLSGEYHPNPRNGNCTYNGATFEQMHAKLLETWKLIRTQAHNRGIKIMGLRVTEAHKDGCPHWHLMVYLAPEQREAWSELVEEYAPGQQSDIQWAWSHAEAAERGKRVAGSASYLLKYIVKAVAREDNELKQFKNADELKEHMAPRVIDKRRAHGWRAFQFFGIKSSMTSWRVMRSATTAPETAIGRQLYKAATNGKAGEWLELLNSENAPRFIPLRIQTDEIGRYGDAIERTEGAILVNADGDHIEAFQRIRRFELSDKEARAKADEDWRTATFAVISNCARKAKSKSGKLVFFDGGWYGVERTFDDYDDPDPPF